MPSTRSGRSYAGSEASSTTSNCRIHGPGGNQSTQSLISRATSVGGSFNSSLSVLKKRETQQGNSGVTRSAEIAHGAIHGRQELPGLENNVGEDQVVQLPQREETYENPVGQGEHCPTGEAKPQHFNHPAEYSRQEETIIPEHLSRQAIHHPKERTQPMGKHVPDGKRTHGDAIHGGKAHSGGGTSGHVKEEEPVKPLVLWKTVTSIIYALAGIESRTTSSHKCLANMNKQIHYTDNTALPEKLAWMVASEFISDATIRFKLRRRATE
ncbi:hypothetical protein PCASD_02840 [Puccinia coronata f. sp. avenae]|uniref:Uncharacterized protein n=1 Tax=Puccinia coronata f. sp. avenae TaxID=200324 RepID=A0A2N5VFX4_9BASI|nr:hypothetical protein PCASD_02840 [Puccinia coronata f. sp. avenae]